MSTIRKMGADGIVKFGAGVAITSCVVGIILAVSGLAIPHITNTTCWALNGTGLSLILTGGAFGIGLIVRGGNFWTKQTNRLEKVKDSLFNQNNGKI